MREVGGSCLKYLKAGGTEKRGGRTKILKRGGDKLGQGAGALKRGGLEPPYELCIEVSFPLKKKNY